MKITKIAILITGALALFLSAIYTRNSPGMTVCRFLAAYEQLDIVDMVAFCAPEIESAFYANLFFDDSEDYSMTDDLYAMLAPKCGEITLETLKLCITKPMSTSYIDDNTANVVIRTDGSVAVFTLDQQDDIWYISEIYTNIVTNAEI